MALDSGKYVIAVTVDRGQLPPYQFRKKAYKRVGNTTTDMSQHEEDQMLLERMHGVSRWENQPAEGWSPMTSIRKKSCARCVRPAAAGASTTVERQIQRKSCVGWVSSIGRGRFFELR